MAVGEVEGGVPGPPPQVAVRQLHLAKHTLALAVAQTTREGPRGLLGDPQHHRHRAGGLGQGLEGHLDIAEQAGAVEAFDVLFEAAAVKAVAGLGGQFPGHHPEPGFALDRLALGIGGGALLIDKLDLDASHGAFPHRQLHHSLGGHLGGTRDPGQGKALVAVPLLQVLEAPLQGVEVEGLAVVGGEGIGNQGGGQLDLAPLQFHLGKHRIGLHRHQQPHPQGPVLGLDAHIGEPAARIDGGEVIAQLTAGHLGTRPGGHGVVDGQFQPLPFRVLGQPLDDHLTDQHFGFAGGHGLGGHGLGGLAGLAGAGGRGLWRWSWLTDPRFAQSRFGSPRLDRWRRSGAAGPRPSGALQRLRCRSRGSRRGVGGSGRSGARGARGRLAWTHQARGEKRQARGESQGAAKAVGTVPAVEEACHGSGERAAMPQSSADLTCRCGVRGRPLGPVCRPPRRPRPHRPGPGGSDPCPKCARWHRPPGCSKAGRCRG